MSRIPPSTVSSLLSAGTALIGALLAYQATQSATITADDARTLLYAFLLSGLFALTALLFAKGEAQRNADQRNAGERRSGNDKEAA